MRGIILLENKSLIWISTGVKIDLTLVKLKLPWNKSRSTDNLASYDFGVVLYRS